MADSALPFRKALFIETEAQSVSALVQPYLSISTATLYLAETADPDQNRLTFQQARQVLGQTFAVVIIDATQQFQANAFAIAVGTLRAGGVLLVCLSKYQDSGWLTRLRRLIQAAANHSDEIVYGDESLLLSAGEIVASPARAFQLTGEQQQLQQHVIDLVNGTHAQSLLLTGERGTGKSTATGHAIAQLLDAQKSVVVTAPSRRHADTLLNRVKQISPGKAETAALQFIAPDRLCEAGCEADLLVVEEAAALPQKMLRQWADIYPRVIWTTTEHGYEGSGNGFAVKFTAFLQQRNMAWQKFTLTQPIRWTENDALEKLCQVILLSHPGTDFEAPQFDACQSMHFRTLSADILLADETLLIQVFDLLRLAHYRTRPSDLQAILDDPGMRLSGLFDNQTLIAVIWLVQEGPLNAVLTQAVHRGERRLKSDLLPQVLLTYAGLMSAAGLRYQRIMRIAVHPACRRSGVGSALLQQTLQHLPACDLVGCSFAAQPEVIDFWLKHQFEMVRLGLQTDTVTASHALLMLRAVSQQGAAVQIQLRQRFAQQWSAMHARYLSTLPAELTELILANLTKIQTASVTLSEQDWQDIEAFAWAKRALAFSYVPLQRWLAEQDTLARLARLPEHDQTLLLQVFCQQRAFNTVIANLALPGEKALLQQLRNAVRNLLLMQ